MAEVETDGWAAAVCEAAAWVLAWLDVVEVFAVFVLLWVEPEAVALVTFAVEVLEELFTVGVVLAALTDDFIVETVLVVDALTFEVLALAVLVFVAVDVDFAAVEVVALLVVALVETCGVAFTGVLETCWVVTFAAANIGMLGIPVLSPPCPVSTGSFVGPVPVVVPPSSVVEPTGVPEPSEAPELLPLSVGSGAGVLVEPLSTGLGSVFVGGSLGAPCVGPVSTPLVELSCGGWLTSPLSVQPQFVGGFQLQVPSSHV